jgi:rod shape-determining protein MreD
MKALFFIFFTLLFIVVQTIILPGFSFFINSFDLMIINVLLLCLLSTRFPTVLSIILIGMVMDSISGVPFFYHVFSYIWIYLLVYLVRQIIFQRSLIFILVISLVSVIIQHGLLLFSIAVSSSDPGGMDLDFRLFLYQLFWGGVCIPPGVWLMNALYKHWIKTSQKLVYQWQKAQES